MYRASKLDCDACPLKRQCCPKEPSRNIPRDIHEHARDVTRSFAGTEGFETSRRQRKKLEMQLAHLKRTPRTAIIIKPRHYRAIRCRAKWVSCRAQNKQP
ncbi:transposase [Bradyrhizobium sp. WYCCWR 13023]|uniref:Transposase n=1 Tax=Bradyrhizobium zhengyangense TaxID=2911009 RepID=A0A9X1UBV4_9BRAD|nr:transposase [Bradyrhizobium zhengyangense]MCG2632550.1 transposase [Bradyrhizobium zhengyangense]